MPDLRNFYTIPAGIPFADALAQGLRTAAGSDDPAALASYRIFLPTRRACRTLRDTFLRLGGGAPLLLPVMQPLGDVDDDELSLTGEIESGAGEIALSLPPAMPPMRRRLLLARLVMALPAYADAPDKALAVAEELGRLMDRIHTENLTLDGLAGLVSADYATHWQITLDFLSLLAKAWPQILAEHGMIDAADRRNRLMRAMANHLRANPPQTPVIAAGSTGSIPATGELLSVIAGLPQGCVVLPGLDRGIDSESWDALDDTHPQATLKQLLERAGVGRNEVKDWPHLPPQDGISSMRSWLARETMRPAATAGAWTNLHLSAKEHEILQQSLQGVARFECAGPQEEADVIALLLRGALENPGRRAALVTPDRALARRVAASCRRWGLTLDDSAGMTLPDSSAGSFLRLCAAACAENLRSAALLALLRHPRCKIDADTQALEIALLRGPAPAPGIAGLRAKLAELEKPDKDLESLIGTLSGLLSPFLDLHAQESADFAALADTHLAVAENLAGGADDLWDGDDGEAAAQFFTNLREHADIVPPLRPADYLPVLEQMMKGASVRTPTGAHPRLTILGQLEARLIQADLVIMGGLNEGTWPALPAADPWMSRPMRKAYGLPSPERGTGLAAHDFVQGFCAPDVVLTRAKRAGGTASVPARWLTRLDTVLTALGINPASLAHAPHLHFARAMNRPAGEPRPFARPAPVPPAAVRPQSLYVTAIEKLMRDPYSIYARYILRLKKLDPLEQEADAARRGEIMHKALDAFVRKHPDKLPENALELLLGEGRAAFGGMLEQPRLWAFWWPRFMRLAAWFVEHEREWRQQARPCLTEAKGETVIAHGRGNFIICAKADRIDMLRAGGAAIVDYKTGAVPSAKDIEAGFSPQLPLEAVIAEEGGFRDLGRKNADYLGFWRMTGGQEAGREIGIAEGDGAALLAQAAREGIARLAETFADPATPYYSLPRPDKAPPAAWQDYAHLARVQEWVALGDPENEGA